MQERPKVAISCLIWKDDKFLMMQRTGAHGAGTWCAPGGKLEFGETWADCAKREVLEEVSLEIGEIAFLAVTNDVFDEENKHFVTIWLNSKWISGEAKIMEPDKCLNLEWHTFKDLPETLFEPCWQNLRAIQPELFD